MPTRELLVETRAGLAHAAAGRFTPPPSTARVRRVFYGPGVLIGLARSVWASPALRRRYLRTMLPQVALTLVVGVIVVVFFQDERIEVHGANLRTAAVNGAQSTAAFVASLIGALALAEWGIIALAREHHDALSYDVSTLVGVPAEEEIPQPRVRLNVNWLVTKFKRRVQGGLILAFTVAPPAFLAVLVLSPVAGALFGLFHEEDWANGVINVLPNVITAAGGAYWLGVFTMGKTAHAWRDENVADPFFLRFVERSVARFPRLLGWMTLYARLSRSVMGLSRRPASVVEHAGWETFGFVVARIVVSVPGVYLMFRPLIPVAATVIIAARAPATLRGLPVALVLDERQ